MPVVTIRSIDRENWREALTLTVRPDQQRFVADYAPIVLIGLAKAYVGSLGLTWLPYAIYADDILVGFVALAYESESHDEYWIYHFFIDQRYQGKSYGTLALKLLIIPVSKLSVHQPDRASRKYAYSTPI